MQAEILELFKQNNSPFSLQTVINFTASKYSKTFVQRALDALVQEEKISFLQVGKSGKLYVYNQSLIKPLSQEQIDDIEKQNKDLEAQIEQQQINLASLQKQQKILQNVQTEQELREAIAIYIEKISKIKQFNPEELITNEQMIDIKKKVKKLLVEWKRRKLNLTECLDNLGEGLEKSRKQLFTEIELEETKDGKYIKDVMTICK